MSSSGLPSRKSKKNVLKKRSSMVSTVCVLLGLVLIGAGAAIFFLTFYPAIRAEVGYSIAHSSLNLARFTGTGEIHNAPAEPVDREFGILIPKIGANARVIADVDPNNSTEYQAALAHGVAHAKGTVFPGQTGNMFLFSHSSVDFFIASQFNSVFYLIHKLENGDTIDLYYRNQQYTYTVTEKKTVDAKDVSFLSPHSDEKTLTLMTCWPPGTTLKRLIVRAHME